jgi:hypothetical protein
MSRAALIGSAGPKRAHGGGAALTLALGAFVVGLAPLADGDLWWHLAAGREIVRTHALPVVDTFSSGAAGRPWIDVHWGFQLAAYAVHALGGLRALVLVKCALVAAGALVLLRTVARDAGGRARPVVAVAAVALVGALFVTRGLLLVRPVIATLVFLAVYFALLERFRREGRAALLAPLPVLQVVWANVQGLSMLGPALVGAYTAAMGATAAWGGRAAFPFAREDDGDVDARRAARWLLGALGLCLVACAATPYGLAALALPFRLLARLAPGAANVYAANVAENVPPWALERTAPGQVGHLMVFLLLLAASLVAARRVRLSHVLVLGGLVALALAANRNVLLLYWLGTPIGVMAASPLLRRVRVMLARRRGGPGAARWLGRLASASVLAVALGAAAREPSLAAAAPFRVPAGSADVIAARGGAGTIFAADQFGGYLIWRLAPAFRPFIDTRLVLRSADEFAEYLALVDQPQRFDEWEARHPMDYVLLPVGYPDRYLGLTAHLHASTRWRLIFTDGTETLFARRGPGPEGAGGAAIDLTAPSVVDQLAAALDRRFAGDVREAARLQLATLELAVGQPALAERALEGIERAAASGLRARARLAAGDLDEASRVAALSLARDPDDVRSLDLAAVIAARRGDTTKAVALLRRALQVNPFDPEAGRILETWEDHVESQ